MFKKWIKSASDFDNAVSEDVNVDIARANYAEYEKDIKEKQQKYIKELCKRIKEDARKGCKSITTFWDLYEKFLTYDFQMNEIMPYFTQRGFKVTEESSTTGVLETWLRISWED